MRSKKDNENYFKEERIKKDAQIELYKKQDKELIDKMIYDYKWFHAVDHA